MVEGDPGQKKGPAQTTGSKYNPQVQIIPDPTSRWCHTLMKTFIHRDQVFVSEAVDHWSSLKWRLEELQFFGTLVLPKDCAYA